jgi:hypothetical protein
MGMDEKLEFLMRQLELGRRQLKHAESEAERKRQEVEMNEQLAQRLRRLIAEIESSMGTLRGEVPPYEDLPLHLQIGLQPDCEAVQFEEPREAMVDRADGHTD